MQFLWQGLQGSETVAFDVINKPFSRLRIYFKSFGWNVTPYNVKEYFVLIQAFPYFKPYLKVLRILFFNLADFEEMKRIDRLLLDNKVTRFATEFFNEQLFSFFELKYLDHIEDWKID